MASGAKSRLPRLPVGPAIKQHGISVRECQSYARSSNAEDAYYQGHKQKNNSDGDSLKRVAEASGELEGVFPSPAD